MSVSILKLEEEEALYQHYNKKQYFDVCPGRIHTNTRRIWWIPKTQLTQGFFSYSICPSCYRNETKIKNIIETTGITFIPVLATDSLHFNCDAADIEQSYNLTLPNDWRLGIYLIDDDHYSLLDASMTGDTISISMPSLDCDIGLSLYKLTTDEEQTPYKFTIKKLTNDVYTGSIASYAMNNEYVTTLTTVKTLPINQADFKNFQMSFYENLPKLINGTVEKKIHVDDADTSFDLCCSKKTNDINSNLNSLFGMTNDNYIFQYKLNFVEQINIIDNFQDDDTYHSYLEHDYGTNDYTDKIIDL